MKERVVLVTGAALGLGRALTNEFVKKGWRVIATDKVGPALPGFMEDQNVLAYQMDVTSDREVKSVFGQLKSENITIDLIINNAGIDRYFPFSEAPVDNIREVFETNLFGAYRVNQVFLPLLNRPGGRIIHIGSESLELTVPFMPYPLSKNALERYAKVLRQELRFLGIDVVIIRPGAIMTRLLENVLNLKLEAGKAVHEGSLHQSGSQLAVQMERFAGLAPKNVGKVSDPEVVAAFVYNVSQKINPRAVYKINNSLILKITAMLPFSMIEKLIRKRLSV